MHEPDMCELGEKLEYQPVADSQVGDGNLGSIRKDGRGVSRIA